MSFVDYIETNLTASSVAGGSQLLIEDDCPFCGSYGKIYVDVKKEVGICFKCSKGFNAVSYVAAAEGVSRAKAWALIGGSEDRYIGLEEDEIEEEPELWYPPCEPLTMEAQTYMRDRGFSPGFCHKMQLMFCTQNVFAGGKTHYTSNRIIIFIKNKEGEIVSWQARDITGKSKIKYLFQPGFKGAEHLYNIDRVTVGEPIIVVEGVMDAWGWIRAGYGNVVATFGKKISKQQLNLLVSLNPGVVYIAWDGDAGFEKARFAENYSHLFNIRMVGMGEKDADELTKEKLRSLYNEAACYNWNNSLLTMLDSI